MRRLLILAATVLLAGGLAAPAFAGFSPGGEGPSGSTMTNGTVKCGHTNTFLDSPIVVYNDGRGAEVCEDNAPVRGRVMIAHYSPGLLHIDFIEVDGRFMDTPPVNGGVLVFLPVGLP